MLYFFRMEYVKKIAWRTAARAVRDWVFVNTPFNVLYSYMKKENIASVATAESIGMRKSGEYVDAEQALTLVYTLER